MKNYLLLLLLLIAAPLVSKGQMPAICTVTYDPITHKNMIIWEEKVDKNVVAVNVLRQNAAGDFSWIGSVNPTEINNFLDPKKEYTVIPVQYRIQYQLLKEGSSGEVTPSEKSNVMSPLLMNAFSIDTNTVFILLAPNRFSNSKDTFYLYRSMDGKSWGNPVDSLPSKSPFFKHTTNYASTQYYIVTVKNGPKCYTEDVPPIGGTPGRESTRSNVSRPREAKIKEKDGLLKMNFNLPPELKFK
jgi:hypothetical protein